MRVYAYSVEFMWLIFWGVTEIINDKIYNVPGSKSDGCLEVKLSEERNW